MKGQKVRWGIIGCAGIAIHAVIPAIQQSETGEVVAIASRDLDKAKSTAEQLGIGSAYGSYEQLLKDRNIDAVYIPLPNHMHCEWTIRAAQAGKHVLCEKPFAMNAREAEQMVEACGSAGVKLAEAFMYRYHPRYDMVKQIMKSGEIGDIRSIYGAFSFNNAADKNNVRYKAYMGGGAIYDVGCYPISASRLLLEREPEAAAVHAWFSPEHDGVDMSASGILEYSKGISLTFECGMWSHFRNLLQIIGSEGCIEIPSAYVGGLDNGDFTVTVGGVSRKVEVPQLNHYKLQVDAFGRSILEGAALPYMPSDAISNMRVIDACLQSARGRKRVIV